MIIIFLILRMIFSLPLPALFSSYVSPLSLPFTHSVYQKSLMIELSIHLNLSRLLVFDWTSLVSSNLACSEFKKLPRITFHFFIFYYYIFIYYFDNKYCAAQALGLVSYGTKEGVYLLDNRRRVLVLVFIQTKGQFTPSSSTVSLTATRPYPLNPNPKP